MFYESFCDIACHLQTLMVPKGNDYVQLDCPLTASNSNVNTDLEYTLLLRNTILTCYPAR